MTLPERKVSEAFGKRAPGLKQTHCDWAKEHYIIKVARGIVFAEGIVFGGVKKKKKEIRLC